MILYFAGATWTPTSLSYRWFLEVKSLAHAGKKFSLLLPIAQLLCAPLKDFRVQGFHTNMLHSHQIPCKIISSHSLGNWEPQINIFWQELDFKPNFLLRPSLCKEWCLYKKVNLNIKLEISHEHLYQSANKKPAKIKEIFFLAYPCWNKRKHAYKAINTCGLESSP